MPGVEPIVIQPKTNYNWNVSGESAIQFRSLSLLDQAYVTQELTDIQIAEIERQLDLGVIESYYALLTIRKLMEVSAEQLRNAKTLENATKARRDAGTTTEFEVTRAALRVVRAEKDIQSARISFIKLREDWANMLQTSANFDIVVPERTNQGLTLEGVRGDALQYRPDVRAAEKGHELRDLKFPTSTTNTFLS